MATSAFDIWVARLALAEGAAVLAFLGNTVAAWVCAFLRFGHGWISSRVGRLKAQSLSDFWDFVSGVRLRSVLSWVDVVL